MKNSKGITLIALVVTIIVLLILASVSLNLVLGEHGLITMAKKAKENMELAQIDEQTALNTLYEQLYGNSIGGNGDSSNSGNTGDSETETPPNPQEPKSPIEQAKEDGNYFDEETTLEDSNGNHVVIPAGFKVAEDSGNNVTEGIVIEDNDIKEGIGQGRGNQYVWIPVSNIDGSNSNPIKKSDGTDRIITLGRYEFASGSEILKQKAEDYNNEVILEYYYKELPTYQEGNESNKLNIGQNRTAKELGKFVKSVEQKGGYYFARYEASYGIDGKPNSKISDNFLNDRTMEPPTEEGYLWNCITEIKAAEVCNDLYTTINSDLVNSYAWDTAIMYIQKFSDRVEYSREEGKTLGYNIPLTNTGTNGDEVCKINDMIANASEWTTEYSNSHNDVECNPCVARGSMVGKASDRMPWRAPFYHPNYAFRSILYINVPQS